MLDSGNLPEFLDKFRFMTPQISGDPEAIARVAYELCEDKKDEGRLISHKQWRNYILIGQNANFIQIKSLPL